MLNEQKFKRLKDELEELKETAQQAKGKLTQLHETLKKEFDCDDLKAAKKLLRKLRLEQEHEEKEFEKEYEAYQKELRHTARLMEEDDTIAD